MRYNHHAAAQSAAHRYGEKLVAQGYQQVEEGLYARGAERVSIAVLGAMLTLNEWREDGTCPECGGPLGDAPVSISAGYHRDVLNGAGGPCYRVVCERCADEAENEQ